jgi:transcriptional regulator with XRE-family HTH domain
VTFNLLAIRIKKGWTRAELARRTKITNSYLEKLEHGDRPNPSLMVIDKLCLALGCSADELLGGDRS